MNDIAAQLNLTDPWVFISYAKEDRAAAEALYRRLEHDLLRPWLDVHNLPPGAEWDAHIRTVIRKSRFFIALLSPRAVSKAGYIQKEISLALDVAETMPAGRVFIMPVLLEKCEPPERLAKWHWIELVSDGGYERLRAAFISHLGPLYSPPRDVLAKPPERPALHDAADILIYERISWRGVLLHASRGRNSKLLSDGTWLQLRRAIPSSILELKQSCHQYKRLKSADLMKVMPSRETYRHPESLVTSIALGADNLYVLKSSKATAIAHPDMLKITLAAYGTPHYYIVSALDPVVVESSGRPVFMFMPMRESPTTAPDSAMNVSKT